PKLVKAAVRSDRQGRMLGEHPFDGLERYAGGRPGRRVAIGNLPCIGIAGLQCRPFQALHHRDFIAETGKMIGAAYSYSASPQYNNFHAVVLSVSCLRDGSRGDAVILPKES